MPQQHQTRADVRRDERRRRRAPRVRAASTSVAALTAAALTVSTAVPAAIPAAAGTATQASRDTEAPGVTVAGNTQISVEATGPVAVVENAVENASTTLLAAQNVAMEAYDATTAHVEAINHTTAVVRELVRRAADETDVDVPAVAAAAAPTESAIASDDEGSAFDAASVAAATSLVEDGDSVAVDLTSVAPTPEVTSAADAAVEAAAEKADASEDTEHEAVIVATALEQQTAALAKLVSAPVAAVSVDPAPTPEEIAAAKAAAEAKTAAEAKAKAEAEAAAQAARVAELANAAKQYGNGQIPADLLVGLSWSGHAIRADAAAALEKLNAAFAAQFGQNLVINDGYRSYADQVATKRSRGYWAATPGYSNHGLAVAVDIGNLAYGNAMYQWLDANAPAYGWVNPDWARSGGRKPEPWHWEFTG